MMPIDIFESCNWPLSAWLWQLVPKMTILQYSFMMMNVPGIVFIYDFIL